MAGDQEDFQTLLITGPSQEAAVSMQGTLASVVFMDNPFRAPADFVNKTSVGGAYTPQYSPNLLACSSGEAGSGLHQVGPSGAERVLRSPGRFKVGIETYI